MKFAVAIFACVLAVASAQYNPGTYDPFGFYKQQKDYRYNPYTPYKPYSTPTPYRPFFTTPAPTVVPTALPVVSTVAPVVVPVVKVSAEARDAGIVKLGNEINPDGSYNYFYETQNGIAAQEQGVPRNFGGNPPVVPDVAQGSFSWTSPEGVPVLITYVADENGYQPQGSVIPTPPPVPAQIARALEYTLKNLPAQKK